MILVAVLSMNISFHKSIGRTPFELVFGRKYPFQDETKTTAQDLHAKVISKQLEKCKAEAAIIQEKAQKDSRTYFEEKNRTRIYEIGDLVLVMKASRTRAKFDNRYTGPFEVIGHDKDVYKIRNLENNSIFTRHTASLKPYRPETKPIDQPKTTSTVNKIMLMMTSHAIEHIDSSKRVATSTLSILGSN